MKFKKIKSLFLYIISISLIVVMINFNHYTTIYAQDNQIEEAEYTNAKNNFDHIQSEVLKNQQNLEVLELNIRKFQEELVDVLNSENKISAEEKVEITKQEQANATTILEAKTIKQAETSSQLEISSTLLKKATTTKQANDEIYNKTTVAKTQVAEDEAKTNLDTATVDLNRKAQNLESLKTKTVASEQDVNNKTQALNLLRQDESAKLNELQTAIEEYDKTNKAHSDAKLAYETKLSKVNTLIREKQALENAKTQALVAKEDAIKKLEIATARYNELKESYDTAVSDEAKANLLRKVQEAERVKNQAVDNLYLKQARLDDVNNRISNKQNEINAKTQELTIKNADLSTKRNTYNSIQQTVNQKQQQLAQATLNKTNKENEQRQAEQALVNLKSYKDAQDQKIQTVNNKIIESNQKINQLTAENRRYQELITQIEAEARQGAVGFIMSRNDEAAKNLLTSWIEQGLVTFYPNKDTRDKVLVSKELIDAQNENSAFSKENFRKAIKLAIRINAKRMVSDDIELSQDGTKDVKVSDFYMAYSALSANAAIQVEYHPGVAVKKHYSNGSESSYSLNENLAMGYKYSNPENDVLNAVRAWYDAEKINFEAERDGRPINYKEIEERDYVLAGIVKDTQGQTGHYTNFIGIADYLGTGFNKLTSKNGYISASVMNYDDVMENRYITGTEQTIANLKAIQTSQNMAVAPEEYLASYDAYIANLETRLNKARENISEITNEINTTRFKIVELNTELNNLQREFNDGSYNGRVEDTKRTIENKKAEVLQATQNVQTKTDALRAEQNKLEQQAENIRTVENVIQNIQNSLSGLNSELNILNNEKNSILEDINNAQNDLTIKTNTFNEEARKLEESNRELAQLTRDYDIATQHKLSKEAILNSTTQRFDELTAQLDSKNNVINTENVKLESLLENKNSTEAIKNDKLSVKNSKQSLYDEVVLNRENINNELIIATKKHNKLLESKNNAQNEVDLAIELKNDRQLKYDNAVRLNSEAKIQYAEIILNKEASDRIYNEKLVKFNEDKVNDDNAKSELAIAKANKDNADKAYEDAINNLSRYSENSIQELKERLYDSKVSLANVKEALRNSQNALEQAKIRLQNAIDKLNAKNIELSKQNNKSLNVIPINTNYIEKENKKSDLKTVEKNGDSKKEKVLIPKPTTNKTKDKNVDKKVIVNKDYHNKFLMNLILFVFILSMSALAIFLLFKNKKNNKI